MAGFNGFDLGAVTITADGTATPAQVEGAFVVPGTSACEIASAWFYRTSGAATPEFTFYKSTGKAYNAYGDDDFLFRLTMTTTPEALAPVGAPIPFSLRRALGTAALAATANRIYAVTRNNAAGVYVVKLFGRSL